MCRQRRARGLAGTCLKSLEGAGGQGLHQVPAGARVLSVPESLRASSARPSLGTEAGMLGAHPSVLPQ